ncbi:MAG: Hsp20/alpha crystallin family protein [Gammaproteobacteria bacterium]
MLNEIRQEFGDIWRSLADGWRRLFDSAKSALTPFDSGGDSTLPSKLDVDDDFYFPSHGGSMLGGDVFEDEKRLVVRLEIPGMAKEEIQIEVIGDSLIVSGEKRFERENTEGRWRVLQCAYGKFRRAVPLPAPVVSEKARASYTNGVLRVELPKARPGKPSKLSIQVS